MSEGPQTPEPADQHRWLARLVGDWTYESGEGEARTTGSQTTRMLGDLWLLSEGQGEMYGGGYLSTIGFNPDTGRFTGQWIGGMMTHQCLYDGELSGDGNSLHLMSRGPAFDGSGMMRSYRDTIEIVSPDEHRMIGACQDEDGVWNEMYVSTFRRKGASR